MTAAPVPHAGAAMIAAGDRRSARNSSSCTVEAGSPEGPMGDATCTDGLDNDCDTLIDAADTDCQ
jgi:hypothetical protein